MSALPQYHQMTESEYLTFERENSIRHEYIDGEVFAMSGASEAHNLICGNLITTLNMQLRERPCRVYPSDMRVKVESLYTYPNVTIVCDKPQFMDDTFDTLMNPLVIIEVLSSSTEKYDRGRKFQEYRRLASLQDYVLVSQESHRLEYYARQINNQWTLTDVEGLDSKVMLQSIGCILSLQDVYLKVSFE